MNGVLKDALLGAVAGTLATIPMSVVMLASDRLGLMDKQPPEQITEAALEKAGVDASEPVENELTVVNHLLFGAAAGALFGAVRGMVAPARTPPASLDVPAGIGFGLTVWYVSYEGWVPALGIMPPSHEEQPGRPVTMASAHVVFGACLVLALRWLKR